MIFKKGTLLKLCIAKDLVLYRSTVFGTSYRHLWNDLVLGPVWGEGPLLDAEAQPQGVFLENVQAFKEKFQAAWEDSTNLKVMLPCKFSCATKNWFWFSFYSTYLYLIMIIISFLI